MQLPQVATVRVEILLHSKSLSSCCHDSVRSAIPQLTALLAGDKWLLVSLMYGAGPRLLECLRLRVQGIDFARSEITVRLDW